MLKTHIEYKNGKPFISVNGKLHYPLAYTTYFEECGRFLDFIKHDYKMFFINISFTDSAINTTSNFSPFYTGVFENDEPDYNEFEGIVRTCDFGAEVELDLLFPEANVQPFFEKLTDMTSGTVEGMETGQEYRAFPI